MNQSNNESILIHPFAELDDAVLRPEAIFGGKPAVAEESDVAAVRGREQRDAWVGAHRRMFERRVGNEGVGGGVDDERRRAYLRDEGEGTGTRIVVGRVAQAAVGRGI